MKPSTITLSGWIAFDAALILGRSMVANSGFPVYFVYDSEIQLWQAEREPQADKHRSFSKEPVLWIRHTDAGAGAVFPFWDRKPCEEEKGDSDVT